MKLADLRSDREEMHAMSKTIDTTVDLAKSLTEAQREAQAAQELECQAAAARAKADAAQAKAQAEQAAAKRRWAEGVMERDGERRSEAIKAVNEASQAFEASAGKPETIIVAWVTKAQAQAVVFGIETEKATASRVLGLPEREPRTPHPDFAADLGKVMNSWAMSLLSIEQERVRESLAAAATGKGTNRG